MTLFQTTLVLTLAFSFIMSGPVFDQKPRWVVQSSFGLSKVAENGKYRVITFVPTTYLLFSVNDSGRDLGDGQKYSTVITQDGVHLLMLSKRISNNTTGALGENNSVIFNSELRICESAGCNKDDDDATLKVRAGELFEKTNGINGLITLTGKRSGNEVISGVVTTSDLKDWNREGIVTFTDVQHPRLAVTSEEGKAFNLGCGKDRKENDTVSIGNDGISDADRKINDLLKYANVGNKNMTFLRDYGQGNRSYKFRVYKVTDLRIKKTKNYIAAIEYECEVLGDGSDRMRRILSVGLYSQNKGPIDLRPGSTPKELQEWTGTPHYLYSINTEKQYFQWMATEGKKFPNRAEAGYFLAEFNRSCNSKHRNKRICNEHEYRKPPVAKAPETTPDLNARPPT